MFPLSGHRKNRHHAAALNRAGKKLYNKALPQEETKIRDVLTGLTGHGKVLVVVDQPATIGALPIAVAEAARAAVGYLLGLAMCRIADLHRGRRNPMSGTWRSSPKPHDPCRIRCDRWN